MFSVGFKKSCYIKVLQNFRHSWLLTVLRHRWRCGLIRFSSESFQLGTPEEPTGITIIYISNSANCYITNLRAQFRTQAISNILFLAFESDFKEIGISPWKTEKALRCIHFPRFCLQIQRCMTTTELDLLHARHVESPRRGLHTWNICT